MKSAICSGSKKSIEILFTLPWKNQILSNLSAHDWTVGCKKIYTFLQFFHSVTSYERYYRLELWSKFNDIFKKLFDHMKHLHPQFYSSTSYHHRIIIQQFWQRVKILRHTSGNTECAFLTCPRRPSKYANFLSHKVQEYGVSPVCVLMCLLRRLDRVKLFLHMSQVCCLTAL
jgi:hypothetical protein